MLAFVLCTNVYATNGGNSQNSNNVSGNSNIVDSVVNNNTGSTTKDSSSKSNSKSIATGGKGGNASAVGGKGGNATGGSAYGGTATGGSSSSTGGTAFSGSTSQGGAGGAGGTSNSTSAGGTSTSSGGISSAKSGDSSATGGKLDSNISSNISIGCTENCGANATDKEIAQGNNKALVDAANAKIRNTPSMFGPALVSSNDTCMGSTSGSVAAPGLGIGFGTAWVDENCKMLKNSQALWNMGLKAAAIALMCNDEKINEALEITGFKCPAKPQKVYTDSITKSYEQ